MSARIFADSCCDLNQELKEKLNIEIVPLSIFVNDKQFIDNENLDKEALLSEMRKSKDVPKTASPGPEAFLKKFRQAETVFVVTLSNQLSATYQNAKLAKNMLKDEVEEKFIHIFDSLSASVGETVISAKIGELLEEGYENNKIVKKVNEYIKEMKTMFVLDSLDNLIKAGRLSKIKGKLASILNIKPVMGSDGNGNIKLLEKARGSKKALKRLVELVGEMRVELEDRILGIAHCNALDKAEKVKKEIEKKYNFKKIIVVETAGISTVYANEGGIIIAF